MAAILRQLFPLSCRSIAVEQNAGIMAHSLAVVREALVRKAKDDDTHT
jgi:hypothetical protein